MYTLKRTKNLKSSYSELLVTQKGMSVIMRKAVQERLYYNGYPGPQRLNDVLHITKRLIIVLYDFILVLGFIQETMEESTRSQF